MLRECKICGKTYEDKCNRCNDLSNMLFRWQTVACCPEHAEEYFKRVLESRGKSYKGKETKRANPKSKKK